MTLLLQIVFVAALTMALFFGTTSVVARVLQMTREKAHLAAMGVRLFLVVLLVVLLLVSGTEHRIALVFTVGAASFAAAVVDGLRLFRASRGRKQEMKG